MQPCRDEPGMEFDYISGSTQIMAEVLEAAYGKPLDELVREKIWEPLGASTAWWGKDREDGDFKGFCCLYATARDFGRIGQLYLDSGMWRGKQLVPREFWEGQHHAGQAIMDHGAPNQRYGYFWWFAEVDGQPIHYCRGFHGEYVVVVPHEDLVLVRLGMKREEVNATGHPQDVFEWIGIARELAKRV
jgi:CubicO group peptidase (beta-lactamase class C family)